jgi:hypothetical protein
MLHFKRLLWLAAWGVWIWLGFGLHRALPRDLGPVACSHPLGDRTSFVGFLGDESKFVTVTMRDREKPAGLAVWDAFTGKQIAAFDGPIGAEGTEYDFNPKQTFALGQRVGRDDGLSALDIKTGEWTDFPPDATGARVFHQEKPWAMFWEWAVEGVDGGKVYVFDLKSGERILHWKSRRPGSPPRDLHRLPIFIGDRVGVPTRKPGTKGAPVDPKECELEVWSIPQTAAPEQVVKGVIVQEDGMASPRGRILWTIAPSTDQSVDVFDLALGDFVFSEPPRDKRGHEATEDRIVRMGHSSVRLSRDGRFVHWPEQGRLWNVDRNRECWIDRPGQRLMHLDARSRMEILEEWQIPGWEDWQEDTFAVRDAATGSLLYRTWKMCLDVRNADDTLQVEFDGDGIRIHHLPPPVNWPLFAVCQTILALPLILLWAALKWKARRAKVRECGTGSGRLASAP